MTEVISVRFKNRGKAYYFAPGDIQVEAGGYVVVETSKGLGCGECVLKNHYVEDERVTQPLQPVVRIATENDLKILESNKEKEKTAFRLCKQKIAEHKLDMKLVDVEYNFEGNKILFFFTSDGRVDFRDLVKDLASVFKTRIELRQIGVRDEARMLGGLGICGKPFCCSSFLDDFQSVSIKMAKTQSLSLNPTKISGTCGRLMCCLRYEQAAYEDLVKRMPKVGAQVNTPDGAGSVSEVGLLRQRVKVRLENQPDIKSYGIDEVGLNGEPAPKRSEEAKKPAGFDADSEVERAMSRLAGSDTPSEKKSERPSQPRGERPEQRPRQPRPDRPDQKPRQPRGDRPEQKPRQPRPDQKPRPPKPNGQEQKPRPPKQGKSEQPPRPQPQNGEQKQGEAQSKPRRKPRYRKRKPGEGGGAAQPPKAE